MTRIARKRRRRAAASVDLSVNDFARALPDGTGLGLSPVTRGVGVGRDDENERRTLRKLEVWVFQITLRIRSEPIDVDLAGLLGVRVVEVEAVGAEEGAIASAGVTLSQDSQLRRVGTRTRVYAAGRGITGGEEDQ